MSFRKYKNKAPNEYRYLNLIGNQNTWNIHNNNYSKKKKLFIFKCILLSDTLHFACESTFKTWFKNLISFFSLTVLKNFTCLSIFVTDWIYISLTVLHLIYIHVCILHVIVTNFVLKLNSCTSYLGGFKTLLCHFLYQYHQLFLF